MVKQLLCKMLWTPFGRTNSPRLATFSPSLHHLRMCFETRFKMPSWILLISVLFTASASAGIVEDVRGALARNNFSAAESVLNSYRSQQGITAEYLDAYSWLGRAAL